MLSVGRALLLLLLSVLHRAVLVSTAPTLAFPINSQVPPVARIGEPFSFVFASSTFTSSASGANLSYSLTDPPTWLSLDSDNRRLYGTPRDSDVKAGTVVGIQVALVATDATGSTSDDATLVVSRNPGPSVQVPISEQIQSFGSYSEPSSLLFYPDQDFKLPFANDTFSDPDAAVLNYYTVMVDNSPLPAWVSFDPGTLAFVGTTPPFSSLVEPPQTFSMKLIASDVTGFSATSVSFSIVVGTHTLTTDQPSVALNATAGHVLTYDGLAGSILVDGRTAVPSDVNVTTQNLPSWLAFDPSSWDISGTAPDDAQSTIFTAIFEDAYADVLNVTLDVQIANSSSLFQSTFPDLSVKAGGQFSFDLTSYLRDPSGVDATADIQPATSWISWDASAMTLSGSVPTSASKSVIDVMFTVEAKGGGGGGGAKSKRKRAGAGAGPSSQSQTLTIQVEASSAASATPTSTTTASTSSTAAASTSTSTTSAQVHNPNWTIVAIVISVVAGLALLACLCFFCCSRRKKTQRNSQATTLSSARISAPLPDSLIYTPGHAPGSPSPEPETGGGRGPPPGPGSNDEKEKSQAQKKKNKTSHVRSELTPPPTLADVYNEGLEYSVPSTPGSRKVKEWFASLRSVRFVQLRRVARPRVSSSIFLPDDGRSHHDLDLDLEFAPGPPVLHLPLHHHGASGGPGPSFRQQMEVEVPALASSFSSPHKQTQEQDGDGDREGGGDLAQQAKGKTNLLALPTPNASSIRLVEKDPFTDTPISRLLRDEPISPLDERDPFNSHPISPISLPVMMGSGGGGGGGGGSGGPATPYSAPVGPPSLLASSSLLPTFSTQKQKQKQKLMPRRAITTPAAFSPIHHRRRRSTQHQHQQLRPAHSQKSIATSHHSSSTDTYRGRTRNKFTAKAKGALFVALQSPKRRTLAALGKRPSFTTAVVSRKKRSSHRGVLESVDCDSESVLGGGGGGDDGGGGGGEVRGTAAGAARRTGGGIAGFLSPRLWPQPGPGHPPSVPTPKVAAPPPELDSESHRRRQRNMSGSVVSASSSGSGSGSGSGRGSGGGGRAGSSRSSRGSSSTRGFTPQRIPNHPPIRRRPVGAPPSATRSSGGSGESGEIPVSTSGAAAAAAPPPVEGVEKIKAPPLRNPLRRKSIMSSSSPFGLELGLGIMGGGTTTTTYEDLVNNSQFHPSRDGKQKMDRGEEVVEEEEEEDDDDDSSWTDGRSSSLPATNSALGRGSAGLMSVTESSGGGGGGGGGWTSAREGTPSVLSMLGHISPRSSAMGGKNWITHGGGGGGGPEVDESPVIPKGWRRPSAGEAWRKVKGGAGAGAGGNLAGERRAVSEGTGEERHSGTATSEGGGSGVSKASSDGRAFV